MTPLLNTEAGPLSWRDYGGAGKTLVLVHGLGGSVANWELIGPRLAEHRRVVALDLPGFGHSPPARDWSLQTHAEAIRAFASEFAGSVTLLGNSLGGLLCEMVASSDPDLVEGLILISPATPPRLPDDKIHWPTARRLLIQATPGLGLAANRLLLERYDAEGLVKLTLSSVVHKPSNIPIELIDEFIELAEARRKMPWAVEAVPKTATSIARLFTRPRHFVSMLRRISAPTLVIHGVEDRLVSPTSVEWMCSLRPDWEFAQMTDTGHTPQLDAPVRLLQVLEPWLAAQVKNEIGV